MMTNSDTSLSRSALTAGVILISMGCNLSDGGAAPHLPPDQYFSVLSLEHHAINLSTIAPYDTITLKSVAVMADGSSVLGEVSYSVSDPAISVRGGVLKADSAVTRAVVRATLTHGTVTHTDSAIVSVTDAPPSHMGAFGIQLSETDSAKIAVGAVKTIPLVRQSESGDNLSGLQISVRSSDTTVAKVSQSGDSLYIISVRSGRVMLYVSTFAFGAAREDSLLFTVGWPLLFHMPTTEMFRTGSSIKLLDFMYRNITLGVGGCVVWTNRSLTLDLDVKFDDTTHVGPPTACEFLLIRDRMTGGNIAPYRSVELEDTEDGYVNFIFAPYRARAFSAAGTFPFRSITHGTQGVVRVCNERNDTTCAPQRLGAWY